LLGFNLSLTKDFILSNPAHGITDLHRFGYFCADCDTNYAEQVPGYAEPIIVRVYDKSTYDALSASTTAGMVKSARKITKFII